MRQPSLFARVAAYVVVVALVAPIVFASAWLCLWLAYRIGALVF